MPLSPTETRVLELFDQGKSWKQIAAILGISVHTARDYGRRIIAKTFTVEMLAQVRVKTEKNIRGAAYVRRSGCYVEDRHGRIFSRRRCP